MMKLLVLTLVVLTAKLAFAAVEAPNTIDSTSNFFPKEIWAEIGKFLTFPQQELGYLNKAASEAVFKLYPYRKFIENRYGIHELSSLENDKDMAWFKNLLLVDNPLDVFCSISSGFFDQRAFPNSKGPMSLYMIRVFSSLPAEVISLAESNEIILTDFVQILFELEYYTQIIEIFKLFPFIIHNSMYFVNIEMGTKLIKQICNVSEEKYSELFEESVEVLNLIIANIYTPVQRSLFLYCSMMANVPLKYYIDKLLNETYFSTMIEFPCSRKHPKLSAEESERMYEMLLVILNTYRAKIDLEDTDLQNSSSIEKKLYEIYKVLFKIRFKPVIEEDFYELEIKNGNFNHESLRQFANYALFSGRIELFKQILYGEKLVENEDVIFNQYIFADFVYGLQAIELFPEKTHLGLFNSLLFLKSFSFLYDAIMINFDMDQILTITFKRNVSETLYLVPETFEYVYDTKTRLINSREILEVILSSNTVLDTDYFIGFFKSIADCFYFHKAILLTQLEPLKPTMNMLKRFSQSEELCDLAQEFGLKFLFIDKIMANLFKENIICANFVIPKNDLLEFLPLLSTRTQIENFERFMGKSIADLILSDTLPAIKFKGSATGFVPMFYKYRTLLHYLLNGPHKARLLELDIPDIRRLLAREVCGSDANFLTEGLEPEIPEQNDQILLLEEIH